MNEYDYDDATDGVTEPDPRIVAMHRVVDLEKQAERAGREAEQRQKMAHIAREELNEARDHLAGLLGYPSNNKPRAMTGEEVRKVVAEHYR